jgi:predicted DNA-binding transcriptional regulator
MVRSFIILLIIMLASGIFGGFINYFMNNEENKKASIIYGIGASLMVPLFLNMISSNILDKIWGSELNPYHFVFTGVCIVAAISSRAFIKNISSRIFKDIEETKKEVSNVKGSVNQILDSFTEVDHEEEIKEQLSDDQKKVLTEMARGKMVLRTIKGIAKETQLSPESVNHAISDLTSKGFVRQHERDGSPRWVITLKGRKNVPINLNKINNSMLSLNYMETP